MCMIEMEGRVKHNGCRKGGVTDPVGGGHEGHTGGWLADATDVEYIEKDVWVCAVNPSNVERIMVEGAAGMCGEREHG